MCQRLPLVGQLAVAVEGLHQIGRLADIAQENAAHQTAIPNDQLLVGAALRFGELHDLIAIVNGFGDAHGGHLHTHDF